MKIYKLLIILLFTNSYSFCQNNGIYKAELGQWIEILNDSTAKMSIHSIGGFTNEMRSVAKYKKIENYIDLLFYKDDKLFIYSDYIIIDTLTDKTSIELFITDYNKNAIRGSSIYFTEQDISGISDNEPIRFYNIINEGYIMIKYLGYSDLKIDVSDVLGKKIQIRLVEGKSLINEHVLFRFDKTTPDYLFGPYFYNDKNKIMDLKYKNTHFILNSWPWHWGKAKKYYSNDEKKFKSNQATTKQ